MLKLIVASIAIIFYLVSAGVLVYRLCLARAFSSFKPFVLLTGALALALHSYLLYHGINAPEGMNFGIFNAFSLVSWLLVVVLLIGSFKQPMESLGLAVFPMAALAIALEVTFHSSRIISSTGPWQLELHIMISILAYSMFTLAMLQAILLAVQDRHLHNRQPGGFISKLPPLQTMESLLFQMIAIGFVLLTIGLLTGILFLDDIFGRHLAHKTILSIVAWIIFAILLWGRYRFGWRGRKAIRWTLGGFITLMLAYFGTKLVLELVLGH